MADIELYLVHYQQMRMTDYWASGAYREIDTIDLQTRNKMEQELNKAVDNSILK